MRRLCSMVTEDEPASWLELQDLRHRRIPTVPNQLASRLEDQLKALKGRGYKYKSVTEQFEKALCLSREAALQKVNKTKEQDRLILSLPYDRRMANISSILNQHWSYSIKQNPDLKKVLPKPPMVSYTRPKNLRDILVRSQLPPLNKRQDLRRRIGFKRCNMTQCETCPYTKNTTTHKSNFTNKSYSIKEELSCYTENTIYSLTCIKGSGTFNKKPGRKAKVIPVDGVSEEGGDQTETCPLAGGSKVYSCPKEGQYIGKTSQPFRERMSQHRRSVNPFLGFGETTTPVGFHFSLPGHSLQHMQVIALEQVKSKDPYIILARESFWIRKYQAVSHGLNSHQ